MSVVRRIQIGENHKSAEVLNRPTDDILTLSGQTPGATFAGFATTPALAAEATARGAGDVATLASAHSYADALASLTSLVAVGALASGSIAPGFGDINIGTHALTAGAAALSDTVTQTTAAETMYVMRFAGGNLASPVAPTVTTILGRQYFEAWDTAAYGIASTVVGEALGAWSPTDHYGGLAFQCAPQGSTFVTTMARLSGWRFYVVENANDAVGPSLAMSKSRGNVGAPLYPQALDILGNLEWRGYDQVAGGYQIQASIYAYAVNAWSATDRSTQMVFNTTATGSTVMTARWQISHDGNFRPFAANTYDIGSVSVPVRFVFASSFQANASVAGRASLNIPHGVAPTSPVNGDTWTTTAGLFIRINGTTVGPLT